MDSGHIARYSAAADEDTPSALIPFATNSIINEVKRSSVEWGGVILEYEIELSG